MQFQNFELLEIVDFMSQINNCISEIATQMREVEYTV